MLNYVVFPRKRYQQPSLLHAAADSPEPARPAQSDNEAEADSGGRGNTLRSPPGWATSVLHSLLYYISDVIHILCDPDLGK